MGIETPRLILRQWQASDLEPFHQLNRDPNVMRYFPAILSKQESDSIAERLTLIIEKTGWGFWAVELKETNEFIGFVGLLSQDESGIPETPFVEIGWRLSYAYWGKGYASEAAHACLKFAFEQLNLDAVYAFTALPNKPSRKVMERLEMHNIKHDFDHPSLAKGHVLERHCLYKITSNQWSLISAL